MTENRLKVNWIHYSVHFQFRLDWKLTENWLNNEFSQLSVKIQGLNLAWILFRFSQLSVSFQSRFSKCIQTITPESLQTCILKSQHIHIVQMHKSWYFYPPKNREVTCKIQANTIIVASKRCRLVFNQCFFGFWTRPQVDFSSANSAKFWS